MEQGDRTALQLASSRPRGGASVHTHLPSWDPQDTGSVGALTQMRRVSEPEPGPESRLGRVANQAGLSCSLRTPHLNSLLLMGFESLFFCFIEKTCFIVIARLTLFFSPCSLVSNLTHQDLRVRLSGLRRIIVEKFGWSCIYLFICCLFAISWATPMAYDVPRLGVESEL